MGISEYGLKLLAHVRTEVKARLVKVVGAACYEIVALAAIAPVPVVAFKKLQ